VAISGAAVSTGLGWRTSVGLSVLLGLFNVRLGHWWQSDIDPETRPEKVETPSWLARRSKDLARWLPVQAHLGAELLARFPGTDARDWYLTDGGHFETTGAYELLRRRVRLIIVCDHSADPECGLDELGNLVRKARTDFGAAIEFATQAAVSALSEPLQRALGTLADLGFPPHALVTPGAASASPRRANRYATFARVTYADRAQPSLLVYLRPAVLGVEPVDVLAYHQRNAGFPQQSTGDQFFDEAQWESYRRLGEHMGDVVLQPFAAAEAAPARWREVMEELERALASSISA
jgi:hypothetical protein